ncbi:MAG: hypothetical protein MI741_08095, partial [Rhodospirillales bacterium]|nr:hypothetical protein [Rhodospirillales bacterium]
MKTALTIILAIAMITSLIACGAEAPAESSDTEPAKAEKPAKAEEPAKADEPADPVKGKKVGFINAGPDDYYAQFGKTLKAVA